jgi:beta-glucosidase
MRAKLSIALSLVSIATSVQAKPSDETFRWGAASAAYQVEGATQEDGRGPSIWDEYLDGKSLGGPGISGAVAINFYDRNQYLKDIAIMKKMGLSSYRFSVSWPRLIPDGLGPVNVKAVEHYRQFIVDLKAAGIRPMMTLYHWDMPLSLAHAGGWENRASVDWYNRYALVVFANFHDLVDVYVLVNEPLIERSLKLLAEKRMSLAPQDYGKAPFEIVPTTKNLPGALRTFNHLLLASAAAKRSFDKAGYKGEVGIAVPLFPVLAGPGATGPDHAAGKLADGVVNRWFLDAIFKGSYPADVLAAAKAIGGDTDIQPGDAATIGAAKFDYLGINYYAPLFIRRPADAPGDGYAVQTFLPEGTYAAQNGAVRPDQFKALLDRIRTEYANPVIYVTENGAGFPGDDELVDGKVNDVQRCRYIVSHVAAMKSAMAAGSDVRGYHVWSSHDNLEWLQGYGSRFGMTYVDFDTQQRIPKRSFEVYSRIIKGEILTPDDCSNDS